MVWFLSGGSGLLFILRFLLSVLCVLCILWRRLGWMRDMSEFSSFFFLMCCSCFWDCIYLLLYEWVRNMRLLGKRFVSSFCVCLLCGLFSSCV